MSMFMTEPHATIAEPVKPSPELRDCSILIVDDLPLARDHIAAILKASGFWNIEFAGDGLAALELIPVFQPDLVLLDFKMPGLDGLDVCRLLRADPRTAELPILINTAMTDEASRSAVYKSGASDFLTKPVHRHELIARVCTQLRTQVTIRGLRHHVRQTQEDLEAARMMQLALLPSRHEQNRIVERTGIAIGSCFRPSATLGGDLWGICELDRSQLAVHVVDFAGHGVSAALNTFRLHALLGEFAAFHDAPDRLLTQINERLATLLPVGQFATMLYGVLDLRSGHFRYAAAGTPTPLVWQSDGAVARLDGSGVPLGIAAGVEYELREAALPRDASLLVYSDGLTEGNRREHQPVGEEAVVAAIGELRGVDDPREIVDELYARLLGPAEQQPADDVTVVCIRH
jgi:sigma-B regulation protein RsbU (phosphoserine phosphatase)